MNNLVLPQPEPVEGDRESIWQLVIADMGAREVFGVAKYGTALRQHNGRDALVDAYQEALDLVVYIRQLIEERNGTVAER